MYQDLKAPIYTSLHEELRRCPKPCVPESDRIDQVVLDLHLERLGCGAVLRLGYNGAIYDRKKYPMDPMDYSKTAKRRGDDILIPAPFAETYFGVTPQADREGYIDLTALCAEQQVALTLDEVTGIVCIAPSAVRPITRGADPAFLDRMAQVFADPRLPEPQFNNSEQTRTVVVGVPLEPDGSWKERVLTDHYSPAILVREEQGKTVYYVSHENYKSKGWDDLGTETVLLRSEDKGKTWQQLGRVEGALWCYLFEVKGELYLLGSRIKGTFSLVIARLRDGVLTESTIAEVRDWTNTNATMIANGRILIPTFPRIISADVESDLLDPAAWEFSNPLTEVVPKEWFLARTGLAEAKDYWVLEGNIIQSPDGSLHDLLRLEIQPNNAYAVLLDVSPDGKTLTRNPACDGLVEMPTAVSKFCVRYDAECGLYLALTSYPSLPTPETQPGPPMAGQRNVLTLVASPDLIHWKVLDVLLCDREVMNAYCSARAHAFQYVVWDTDGEDMVYVVREATGFTKQYHDGRFVTLYRLNDFRRFVKERYAVTDFYTNPYHKQVAPAEEN